MGVFPLKCPLVVQLNAKVVGDSLASYAAQLTGDTMGAFLLSVGLRRSKRWPHPLVTFGSVELVR